MRSTSAGTCMAHSVVWRHHCVYPGIAIGMQEEVVALTLSRIITAPPESKYLCGPAALCWPHCPAAIRCGSVGRRTTIPALRYALQTLLCRLFRTTQVTPSLESITRQVLSSEAYSNSTTWMDTHTTQVLKAPNIWWNLTYAERREAKDVGKQNFVLFLDLSCLFFIWFVTCGLGI